MKTRPGISGRLRRVLVVTTASLLLAGAGYADAAQAPSGPPAARSARPAGRADRGAGRAEMLSVPQVERQFDSYLLVQARTRLGLSDAQFPSFGAALRDLQDVRRRQQMRRVQALRELNDLLGAAEPDDALITSKLKEMDDAAAEAGQRIAAAYARIDAVLTVRQRARFRVFEENMERRKQDLLARARQQAGAQAGAPPPQSRP
jgi:hypothetical protein